MAQSGNCSRSEVPQARGLGAVMIRGGVVLLLLALTACDAMHDSVDFERHTLSQLSVPLEGGDFYWFDVKLTAEMPGDSDAAEARRMQWLSAWLNTRNLCANGYEVLERRPFEFLEHNPARYDLRYKIQCSVPPTAAS